VNALQFEGLKVALKQDSTGYVMTLRIHPDQIPEEILRDFVGARYVVAMVRVNDDETPTPYNNRVKKAGMICKDKQFHDFLNQRYEMGNADERKATEFIYEMCGISSRTQLNGNGDAQESFDQLMKEYDDWKFRDVPF